jgi:Bifunctional DNA primase/polymerase, N-terminal/Primase C terminal 2 (PriCT-2)
VFPAPPGAKKSYKSAKHSNGAKWGKTRDPEQIRRDFQRWPDANVAIVTGAESGIFVVETDTKKGHDVDGDAALVELEQKHGKLPDTRMAESPSESKHRYFKHPGAGTKIVNSASMLGHGIDVRGDGGMVIAPPSVRGDGEYRWLNDNDIAEAPQWLIDLTTSRSGGKSIGKGTDDPAGEPQAPIERIRAAFVVIPNDDRGWDDWNKCGLALFRATGGSDDGLAVFHAWSSKSEKYDAQVTADRWAAYKTCPPTKIGVGSIFHWANEASPGWGDPDNGLPYLIIGPEPTAVAKDLAKLIAQGDHYFFNGYAPVRIAIEVSDMPRAIEVTAENVRVLAHEISNPVVHTKKGLVPAEIRGRKLLPARRTLFQIDVLGQRNDIGDFAATIAVIKTDYFDNLSEPSSRKTRTEQSKKRSKTFSLFPRRMTIKIKYSSNGMMNFCQLSTAMNPRVME